MTPQDFVNQIARLSTADEFDGQNPETEDWASTLSELIIMARSLQQADPYTPLNTPLNTDPTVYDLLNGGGGAS